MSGRSFAVGMAVLLAVAGLSWAGPNDDTLRLGGKGEAATLKLGFKGEADTLLVHGGRYGGYRGGYHHGGYGWGGYHHGGYGWGYHGSYRYPFYPRYARPYYAGYYWPYRGFSFGFSVSPAYYYSPPSVIDYTPSYGYFCPTSGSLAVMPSTTALSTQPRVMNGTSRSEMAPPPSVRPPANGTYPYDGGPQNPVPIPQAQPAPRSAPPATIPLDGRVVSLPSQSGKYVYPAYGEKPLQAVDPKPQVFRVVKFQNGR